MVELPRTYRASLWIYGVLSVGLVISIAGFFSFWKLSEGAWRAAAFGGLAVLFVAGIAECLLTRVRLTEECLEVRKGFKYTTLHSAEIVRVVAAKGCPTALELRKGGWFKLPALGTGPHPNTLRAWLERKERATRVE